MEITRTLRLILVACLIICASSGYATVAKKANSESDRMLSLASDANKVALAAAESTSTAAAAVIAASAKERGDGEREKRDLAAQEAMATYAVYSAWATWVNVIVSAGALIALVLTLRANMNSARSANDAAKAASDSAKAAMASVDVARAHHLAENRAWLSLNITGVTRLGPGNAATSEGVEVKYQVLYTVANKGPAPATDVEVEVSMDVVTGFDTQTRFEQFCDTNRKKSELGETIFPADSKVLASNAGLIYADVQRHATEKSTFLLAVFAVATYRSPGSGDLRQTRVLQMLQQRGSKSGISFDHNWSGCNFDVVNVAHVYAD